MTTEHMIPVLDTPIPVEPIRQPAKRPRTVTRNATTKRTAPKRTVADVAKAGVGAAPQDVDRGEPARDDREEPVRRVSRADREVNRFDVPKHRIRQGWDVEWKTVSVYNQPVDGASLREAHDGGWRPERAKDWPELVSPGTDPNAPIEQYGQRLYGRPKALTLQARQEDNDAATRQLRDRANGAQNGQVKGGEGLSDLGRLVQPVPLGVSIEGEVGRMERR